MRKLLVAFLFLVLVAPAALAEKDAEKAADRNTGKSVREEFIEIGHGFRDFGKTTGHVAKKEGIAVGHAFKEAGIATGKAFRELGRDIRQGFTGRQ